jgi:hypothetical protein
MAEYLVATVAAAPNWLHSADIVIADATSAASATRLAEELLRRYPGCVVACVLIRGRQ